MWRMVEICDQCDKFSTLPLRGAVIRYSMLLVCTPSINLVRCTPAVPDEELYFLLSIIVVLPMHLAAQGSSNTSRPGSWGGFTRPLISMPARPCTCLHQL
jgi:hypothetical protein